VPPSLERIVAAARTLLPKLPELLGPDAEAFRRELEELLARAERGEPVAERILDLLRSRPATNDRLIRLLSSGALEADDEAPPPTSARRTLGVGSRPPTAAPVGVSAETEPVEADAEAEPLEADAGAEPLEADGQNGDGGTAPRWILTQVWELSDPAKPRRMRRAFRAGAAHAVKVRVGPIDADWFAAEGATPDESVDARLPDAAEHTLAVIFFVPAVGLQDRRPLVLPSTGASKVVQFSLPPFEHRAPAEAWISLVFEGRHIQSARLAGFAFDDPDAAPEESAMSFQWAAIVPGLAEPGVRGPFDASLWLDARDDEEHVAGVGVPDADDIIAFGDDHLDGILNAIRSLLRRPVDAPEQFEDLTASTSVGLLRALALQGRALHELIGARLEEALPGRPLERIQIVQTDRVDLAPLEFVYDLPIPSQDARLCTGWTDQVRAGAGRCPDANHPPAALPRQVSTVCPLGFWGLSRVIERQVIKARDVRSDGFGLRVAPTAPETRLAPLGGALFGFSSRLDAVVSGQSTAVLETLNAVTSDRARVVDTWPAWVSAISDRPSLLVLLSHTVEQQEMAALEIGPEQGGSRITLVELVPEFVKAEPADTPIVLLLGCDTAVERNQFRSFVAQFLDRGAALVVGTITPVLGEHAAPVAQALIDAIASGLAPDAATPGDRATTFGDLMLDLRRRLLVDGELTALSVTSFGDADWPLSPGG
jgi:hypothetical protein